MTMFGSQWFAAPDTTYEINQSIRFESGDNALLSRSPSSSGSLTTWTLSCWVKRGRPNANENGQWFPIWSASDGSSTYDAPLYIGDASAPGPWNVNIAGQTWTTTQKAADVAGWYHTVVVWDSTNGTAGDRMRLYINGSRVTDFSATGTATSSMESRWNSSSYSSHRIGSLNITGGADNKYLFDGYLAEMVFLDGTASTDASDFGETNSSTGQWIPKNVSGLTFGTNGFYVTGQDSSDLGDDESGNGNDWSSSGLAATDQVDDSPTDNHCVINPLDAQLPSNVTLDEGNLKYSNANSGNAADARGTFAVSSGKWYWEVEADALGQSGVNREFIGIVGTEWPIGSGSGGTSFGSDSTGYAFATTGQKINNDSASSYGSAFTAGQYIGVALDLDNGKIYWSINGTFQDSGDPAGGSGEAFSSISGTFAPAFAVDYGTGTSTLIANFGQHDFQNSPPTGFSALSTANLADPQVENPSKYFHTQLYTGNGSSGHSITNNAQAGDFQPDWLIIAPRSNGDHHQVFDAVRGTTSRIQTNQANAATVDGTALITFETDGFDIDTTDVNYNGSSRTYAAWQWKANGSGSSNSDGSITSTVSADTTAGFSIVQYEGTKSNATIGHGLGVAPKWIIIKDFDNTESWVVGLDVLGFTKNLFLNLNNAVATSSTIWNDTAPTSSVFSIGTSDGVNKTATHISYCFAEVEGFSKFGTYEGNSSADGTFIATGFRPAWITLKTVDSANDWVIYDSKRDPINIADTVLRMDSTNSEYSGSGREIDILSNGFKMRTSNGTINASATFAYMAFAEFPLKYANAR
tara:strand:- start:4398 stop:6818 length:2421 start_codon:yes stop_codon:yes gene_type:complete